jgi:hypothetical protein
VEERLALAEEMAQEATRTVRATATLQMVAELPEWEPPVPGPV